MPSHPLTHHEMLALVEPLSRQGYQLDLEATRRLERRLVCRPGDVATPAWPVASVQARLELDATSTSSMRLERVLTLPDGLTARLAVLGDEVSIMLARLQVIAVTDAVVWGDGYVIALDHQLDDDATQVRLIAGNARVGTWQLTLDGDPVRGMAADLVLATTDRGTHQLPEDLFAVLGWNWGLLRRRTDDWHGTLKFKGRGIARREYASACLVTAAAHLARTFAEPAARFHERAARARWRVAARRALPLAAAAILIAIGAACTRLRLQDDATVRVLLMSSPPILMILFFSLREVPRLEIPPAPRASNAGSWPVSEPTLAAPAAGQPQGRTTT